jgi:hypothetical protein
MTYGMQVSDASGTVVWDTSGILGRSVGTAVLTTGIGSSGSFNVTISGMIDTDELFVNISNSNAIQYTISRSGSTVTINQVTPPTQPTNYYLWAFRVF